MNWPKMLLLFLPMIMLPNFANADSPKLKTEVMASAMRDSATSVTQIKTQIDFAGYVYLGTCLEDASDFNFAGMPDCDKIKHLTSPIEIRTLHGVKVHNAPSPAAPEVDRLPWKTSVTLVRIQTRGGYLWGEIKSLPKRVLLDTRPLTRYNC